ncbi:ARL14 effector protein-like [Mactra antiquata]
MDANSDDDVMIIEDDSDDGSNNENGDNSNKADQRPSTEEDVAVCKNPWHEKWGNNDPALRYPSQVPKIAQFTFQLLGYQPSGKRNKKRCTDKFCATCISRAINLTVDEFKELEALAKANWYPVMSRKQSENVQIQAQLDKLAKSSVSEEEKARQVKQLRMLAFVNPGKFMDDFDPERSEREMKKMNRRLHKEKNVKKNLLYDEHGVFISTGKDVCDCLDTKCIGCHFPCPKCKSEKCGGECRCNRKWQYEYIESEGTGITYVAKT